MNTIDHPMALGAIEDATQALRNILQTTTRRLVRTEMTPNDLQADRWAGCGLSQIFSPLLNLYAQDGMLRPPGIAPADVVANFLGVSSTAVRTFINAWDYLAHPWIDRIHLVAAVESFNQVIRSIDRREQFAENRSFAPIGIQPLPAFSSSLWPSAASVLRELWRRGEAVTAIPGFYPSGIGIEVGVDFARPRHDWSGAVAIDNETYRLEVELRAAMRDANQALTRLREVSARLVEATATREVRLSQNLESERGWRSVRSSPFPDGVFAAPVGD